MGLAEWMEEATPDRREVRICLDRRLVSRQIELRKLIERRDQDKVLGQSVKERQELAEVDKQVESKTRAIVVEGLGWGRWRALMAKHPPAKDQAETFARAVRLAFMPETVGSMTFNAETFVPAAIAASAVEPQITAEEVTELLDKAPPGIIDRIWVAVLEVNLAGSDDPFVGAVAFGRVRPSAKKSRPRSPSGSPAQSSLGA